MVRPLLASPACYRSSPTVLTPSQCFGLALCNSPPPPMALGLPHLSQAHQSDCQRPEPHCCPRAALRAAGKCRPEFPGNQYLPPHPRRQPFHPSGGTNTPASSLHAQDHLSQVLGTISQNSPMGSHPRCPCGRCLCKAHFEGCLPLLCLCPS